VSGTTVEVRSWSAFHPNKRGSEGERESGIGVLGGGWEVVLEKKACLRKGRFERTSSTQTQDELEEGRETSGKGKGGGVGGGWGGVTGGKGPLNTKLL